MSDSQVALVPDIGGRMLARRTSMTGIPFGIPVALGSSTGATVGFPATIPGTFAGSSAVAAVAPTGAVVLGLAVSRFGAAVTFATITFAAGSANGTFSVGTTKLNLPAFTARPELVGAILLVPGDVLNLWVESGAQSDTQALSPAIMLAAAGL